MDTKYLKKVGLYILSAVLALAFIVYLVFHLFNGFTTDITTIAAEIQSKKSVISGDCYIFKDEHYIYSSYSGAVAYLVGDGNKVSINQSVAETFSDSSGYSAREELTAIEDKLSILEESELPKGTANSDTSSVDKKISSYYHLILQNISEGKYSHAMQSMDALLSQMNRRQIIIGERSDFSSVKSSLEARKINLTSSMKGLSETVFSDTSGYFFFGLDGYESTFTVNAAENLTVSSFDMLTSASPSLPRDEIGRSPIGKIATGYKWYIALEIEKDNADEINIGQKYKGVFPYNYDTELSLVAEKVLTDSSSRAIAVFSCNEMPSGFSYLRSQAVEIILSESKGFRVPKTAVRIVDGYEGVYTLYGSTVVFKRIDILLEVEGHYIVSTVDPLKKDENAETEIPTDTSAEADTAENKVYGYLSLYDRIIVSGKDLSDGMVFY